MGNNWTTLFSNPSTHGGASLVTILNTVLNWVGVIAGFIAVLYLILSGITYITAGGNPDQAKKGQQGVINAVIGTVIIVASYFIIRTAINIGGNLTTGGTL